MTTKTERYLTFRDELHQCGYLRSQLKELMMYHFDTYAECAAYFGYSESSVRRWVNTNQWPIAVARLLLTKHRGFLPTTREWAEFRIDGEYLTTPYGKSIHAKELALLHIDFRRRTDSRSNFTRLHAV